MTKSFYTNIQSEDFQLINKGFQRSVYTYPINESLLIKCVEDDDGLLTKTGYKKSLYRLFPYSRYRHMFCEITCETQVQLRAKLKGIRSPIAPTRGIGRIEGKLGLLVQQVSLKDGSLGPTLKDLVDKGNFSIDNLQALNEFAQSFFTLGIVAADIQDTNIVWGEEGDRLLPFIVDGYSDRNLIKLRTFIPWLRHHRLHRCFSNVAGQIGCVWSRNKRVFYKSEK